MIYFLDGNQRVIKIVRSEAVISAIQTQELPEDSSLLRDYLSVRLKNDERLFNAQYMAIKSYGGNRNAFDLYRVADEVVSGELTEYEGVQVAPYELEGAVVEDIRPTKQPLNLTVNHLLQNTDWALGYVASNMPTVTTNFYYVSVKDALKQLQEMYGIEMIFKVEISGNRITSKWVEVYHQLGNRTMKRFNYGTNALSVVRESSQNELYTALIGRGKGEEVDETEEGDTTYGRKITFEDVEWSVANGDPVNKPKGQKYIELPNATAEYGVKLLNGRKVPRIGLVEFNDTEDPEVLIEQTYQELLVRARPKVLFRASVIGTGDMLIGDTVTIHRHDLNFHYQARVRKVVRDRKDNNKTQVEIGDVVHTPSTQRQKDTDSKLDNIADEIGDIKDDLITTVVSADGKNTLYFQNEEPQNPRVGDSWIRDHPSIEGETQWLVWNGEAWELIMDTSDTTKNAREIEAVIKQAEADKQALETEINQTYEDAVAEADRLAAIRDNGITIEAGQIIAGTIDTARLDAVSIVTNGLSANVVKANHIQADNALFDKLFTSTLATDRLSAQSAWIKNGMFANASIDGAKIQDATIGSAKIVNLDVSKISGNIANFIRANFNAVNSNTSIDASGLKITTTQSWDLRLGNSGVAVIDRLGRETGAFRATLDEDGNPEGAFVVVEPGYIGGLARRRPDGSGLLTGEAFINGSTGAFTVRPFTTFHESISMQDEKLLSMGPQGEIVSRGADLNLSTYERHQFYTTRAGSRRGLSVQWDQVRLGRDINMDGYQINNQSDIRLKENIEPSNLNALREIERLEFIEFEWKKDMVANENKPDGRHFGIKAQYSPFLQTKLESEDSYLSVDMIKQVNLNSKASQELLAYTRSLEKRIEVLEGGGQ